MNALSDHLHHLALRHHATMKKLDSMAQGRRLRKAYKWFRDSQSWEQRERQRGFRDARTGRPPQSALPSYKSGYDAGSIPTAIALPVKRRK
jgi:hypothetical protein